MSTHNICFCEEIRKYLTDTHSYLDLQCKINHKQWRSWSACPDVGQTYLLSGIVITFLGKRGLSALLFSSAILYYPVSIYTVLNLITTHAPISAQSSNLLAFRIQPVYFYLLLCKNICCWYSFELPLQVKAIQMRTNNMYFYEKNQKILHKYH